MNNLEVKCNNLEAKGEMNFKLEPIEFLDGLDKTGQSRMMPRILAQATGKTTLPFTEMGKTRGGEDCGRKPES